MKRIRYSKYVPDPAGEMSMEDLLSELSDYLLQSGFQNYMFYDMPEGEQTLDDLRRAIEQALLDGNLLDEEMQERLREMQMDGTLDDLLSNSSNVWNRKTTSASINPVTPHSNQVLAGRLARPSRPSLKSPIKASTFSASKRFAI